MRNQTLKQHNALKQHNLLAKSLLRSKRFGIGLLRSSVIRTGLPGLILAMALLAAMSMSSGCGSSGGGTSTGGSTGTQCGAPNPGVNGGFGPIAGNRPITPSLPRTQTAKWTVLIYMNAANNLEPYSVENIDQMEQAPYNPDVNIVVEWKRLHEAGSFPDSVFDPAAPQWDGTRRYWLTGRGGAGRFTLDQIQDLGSGAVGSNPTTPDLGSWQELRTFVQYGQHNFPANHTLLLIWNHGAGWEHRGLKTSTPLPIPHRGLSYDDQSGDSIETWQIPQALTGFPLDVIAMDCSLMQMVEVDYEMRNLTPLVVGSEDSPPGDGYPYHLWLPALTRNPGMAALDLAKSIADTHASYYLTTEDSSGACDSVTQSVVQTSALPAVATALSNLADVLIANRSAFASQFANARRQAHQYAVEPSGGTFYPEYKDLVEYVTLLEQDAPGAPGLINAGEQLKRAVQNAVIDNRAIRSDSFSNGISIYVPEPAGSASPPQSYDPAYTRLDLATATHWSQWISGQLQ